MASGWWAPRIVGLENFFFHFKLSEKVWGDDHAGTGVIDGRGHEFENGFVSGPGKLGEELTAEKEVGAEHLGNGKSAKRDPREHEQPPRAGCGALRAKLR